MLVESTLFALVLGLCLGGRLGNVAQVNIRWYGLPLAAFLIEAISAELLTWIDTPLRQIVLQQTLLIQAAVYILVWTFLAVNRRLSGMWLIALGTGLNGLVILLNSGFMPVDPYMGFRYGYGTTLSLLREGMVFAHALTDSMTVLPWLSDRIVIPPPYPFPKTVSPGDLLMDVGVCWFILWHMLHPKIKQVN